MTTPSSYLEEQTIARDEVARKNSDLLSVLVAKHSLFIPQRDFDRWRPTVETSGSIGGFFDLGNMTCIATDGLQAWFLLESNRPPFLGHVQHFHWDVPVVRMVPYVKANGEQGFFKSVKDCSAPSAMFGLPPKPRILKEKPARSPMRRKSKLKIALETL